MRPWCCGWRKEVEGSRKGGRAGRLKGEGDNACCEL